MNHEPQHSLSACALLVAFSLTASASEIAGVYDLQGAYLPQRGTAAEITVERVGENYRVTRIGRFTEGANAPFSWVSEPGKLHGNLLAVRYAISGNPVATTGASGALLSSLGDGASDATLLATLGQGNTVRAFYVFSPDRTTVREVALNVTRKGSESFWRSLKTRGTQRHANPTPAPKRMTNAQFTAHVEKIAKDWHETMVRRTYERWILDDPSLAATYRGMMADDLSFPPSQWDDWDTQSKIIDAYENKTDARYRNAKGEIIHLDDVVVREFYSGHLDGFTQVFVFDRGSGAILERGELEENE